LQDKLNYIIYYPKDKAYLSLFSKNETKPEILKA